VEDHLVFIQYSQAKAVVFGLRDFDLAGLLVSLQAQAGQAAPTYLWFNRSESTRRPKYLLPDFRHE
jgi:predicted GNAT superfamily acetyltransferase